MSDDLTHIVWCHVFDGLVHAGDLYIDSDGVGVMTTLQDVQPQECHGQTYPVDLSALRPWRDRKLIGPHVCPDCSAQVDEESALIEMFEDDSYPSVSGAEPTPQ